VEPARLREPDALVPPHALRTVAVSKTITTKNLRIFLFSLLYLSSLSKLNIGGLRSLQFQVNNG